MSHTRAGYSSLQIALHWATAVLVFLAWFTSGGGEAAFDAAAEGGAKIMPVHAWIGITILVLTVLRIVVRLTRGTPPPPANDPPLQKMVTIWGHRLILLLLVFVPIGGMFMWFSGQETPHGLLAQAFLIIVLGHTAIALWHQYGKRDGLMQRMTRPDRD